MSARKLIVMAVLLCGCGKDTVAPAGSTGGADTVSSFLAMTIQVQHVVPNRLAQPVSVQVLNQYGRAMRGVPIEFSIRGGGSIANARTVITDRLGISSTGPWQVRGTDGVDTVTARIPGLGAFEFLAVAKYPIVIARYSLLD